MFQTTPPAASVGMVLEHALITIRPGTADDFEKALMRARSVIAACPGFISLERRCGVEAPDQYLLLVEWETIDDHLVGFRQSGAFPEWRAATTQGSQHVGAWQRRVGRGREVDRHREEWSSSHLDATLKVFVRCAGKTGRQCVPSCGGPVTDPASIELQPQATTPVVARRRKLPGWRGEALRATFWLVPCILVIVALLLFAITIAIDYAAYHHALRLPYWIRTGSADAGRQVLMAIAAAIITIIGVVFFITILALTLASQQFGPRMMRNFMRDYVLYAPGRYAGHPAWQPEKSRNLWVAGSVSTPACLLREDPRRSRHRRW